MPGHVLATVLEPLGLSRRTVRLWIQHGLIARPDGRGRGARYDDDQVARIHAIHALRTREHLTLAQIKRRLRRASPDTVRALAGTRDTPPPPTPTIPATPAPPTYPHRVQRTVAIAPGLTLVVDADAPAYTHRLAEAIHRHYAGPVVSD